MRFDPTTAECLVYTTREGMLAAAGHDLAIRAERFEIEVDEQAWRVQVRVDAASLRVVGALRNGIVEASALGESDRRSIEGSMGRDVLATERYPEIRFSSETARADGETIVVSGTLALHGRERAIEVDVRRDGGGWVAETRLHQPDFGIQPFRTLLGALRVHPDVTVRVTIPAAGRRASPDR